jgi:hypothetical protein
MQSFIHYLPVAGLSFCSFQQQAADSTCCNGANITALSDECMIRCLLYCEIFNFLISLIGHGLLFSGQSGSRSMQTTAATAVTLSPDIQTVEVSIAGSNYIPRHPAKIEHFFKSARQLLCAHCSRAMSSGVKASRSRRLGVATLPAEQKQPMQKNNPVEVKQTLCPSDCAQQRHRRAPGTTSNNNKHQALAAFTGAISKSRSSNCFARQQHQPQEGQHAADGAVACAMASAAAQCETHLMNYKRPKQQLEAQNTYLHNAGIMPMQPTGAGIEERAQVIDKQASNAAAVNVAILPRERESAIEHGIATNNAAATMAQPPLAAAVVVSVQGTDEPNGLSQHVLCQAQKALQELQQQLASRSSTYLYQIDKLLRAAQKSTAALSSQCHSKNVALSQVAGQQIRLPDQLIRSQNDADPASETSLTEATVLELLETCRLTWVNPLTRQCMASGTELSSAIKGCIWFVQRFTHLHLC